MNLTLRRFEKSDLPQLETWSTAVGSHEFMQKVTPLNYRSPDDLDEWGTDFVWYAILLGAETIGGVWVDRRRQGDPVGILGIIIGKPDILGRGFGRRAISMAIDRAVEILGLTSIRLTVRKANVRAVRAYASVGFFVTGEGVTQLPDGSSTQFYRMEANVASLAEAI